MTVSIYRLLLDPEAGDGNGDKDKAPPKDEPKDRAPTLDDMRKKIEERGVDYAARMLLEMSEDNFKFRSRIRDLESKAPGDDAVVLRGDDAKHWQQYRDLGRPGDIRGWLDERKDFKGRLDEIGREKTLAEAAALHGWRPSALTRFAKADGLDVVVDDSGEKDKDGKPVRKGFVVTRGDDGQESGRKALDEYAEAHWKDDLDALKGPPAKSTAADREDPRRPAPKGDDPLARELHPARLL